MKIVTDPQGRTLTVSPKSIELRKMLFEIVKDNPGIATVDLVKKFNDSNEVKVKDWNAYNHLSKMTKSGILESKLMGQHRTFKVKSDFVYNPYVKEKVELRVHKEAYERFDIKEVEIYPAGTCIETVMGRAEKNREGIYSRGDENYNEWS